jgi:hypothetical protein
VQSADQFAGSDAATNTGHRLTTTDGVENSDTPP